MPRTGVPGSEPQLRTFTRVRGQEDYIAIGVFKQQTAPRTPVEVGRFRTNRDPLVAELLRDLICVMHPEEELHATMLIVDRGPRWRPVSEEPGAIAIEEDIVWTYSHDS